MTRLLSAKAKLFKTPLEGFSGVTEDTSQTQEQMEVLLLSVFSHPEARRRLEIAQTCGPSRSRVLFGVVSCQTSLAVPLISRGRGRCGAGARRSLGFIGWASDSTVHV